MGAEGTRHDSNQSRDSAIESSQIQSSSVLQWNPNPDMKIDIEKFDGTGDFRIWRRKITALLAQQRLLRLISDPVVWPTDISDDQKLEMTETATGTIIFHLSDSIIQLIDK